MIAAANFSNPLFWAVLIGWILSVVLHEFAHGLVGYWGGDYTIRDRGGLTLNPLQYVDPVYSLLVPIVLLAMGGIPLPGGSTFIRRDLLKSKAWDTAVSLAGPVMNLLIFFACVVALHPRVGWLEFGTGEEHTNAQYFVAALGMLQLVAVVFNLVPVPPLDGFQALSPWMAPGLRQKMTTPPFSTGLLIAFIVIMWNVPAIGWIFHYIVSPLLDAVGFDVDGKFFFLESLRRVFA